MNKLILSAGIVLLIFVLSCKKGEDYIDQSATFPLNWKAADTFSLITTQHQDTIGVVRNVGSCPLGSISDPNYGTFSSSLFLQFQTTTTSKKFEFATLDSAILIAPYLSSLPKYGNHTIPLNIGAYEVTQDFDVATTSKNTSYSYNPTPVGTLAGYTVNTTDSVYDGISKIAPALRIPLTTAFAQKLIAPGAYADDNALHTAMKGLYIATTNTTDGFVILSTSTKCKIKLYGKNSSGVSITSEFVTGGNNSITINKYSHDNSSKAYTTSLNSLATGDPTIYTCGLGGYFGRLQIPNLALFAKNKNVFKAELTLYSIDTNYTKSSSLGMLILDSANNKEVAIADEYYRKNYVISAKDTTINGMKVVAYKYNIGMMLNTLISNQTGAALNIYPSGIFITSSGNTKLSSLIPSIATLGGSTSSFKPILKIYYTEN